MALASIIMLSVAGSVVTHTFFTQRSSVRHTSKRRRAPSRRHRRAPAPPARAAAAGVAAAVAVACQRDDPRREHYA